MVWPYAMILCSFILTLAFCTLHFAFIEPHAFVAGFYVAGILTVNVVPFPGPLTTSMLPRWFSMMR
jgi:hypothetical protein